MRENLAFVPVGVNRIGMLAAILSQPHLKAPSSADLGAVCYAAADALIAARKEMGK